MREFFHSSGKRHIIESIYLPKVVAIRHRARNFCFSRHTQASGDPDFDQGSIFPILECVDASQSEPAEPDWRYPPPPQKDGENAEEKQTGNNPCRCDHQHSLKPKGVFQETPLLLRICFSELTDFLWRFVGLCIKLIVYLLVVVSLIRGEIFSKSKRKHPLDPSH